MKRSIITLAALIAAFFTAFADVKLRSGIELTPELALGADRQYQFDVPALTPAPQGYEAFHIEHYGRHGSRFAYSSSYYTRTFKALDNGAKAGVLTEFGRDLYKRYAEHYDYYLLRTGDLTSAGWEDLQKVAGVMYDSFPSVFSAENGVKPSVFACASSSFRSVMSMSAFCLGLKAKDAQLPVRQEQGRPFLNETNPRDNGNPGKLRPRTERFPYPETLDEFQSRRVDNDAILGRMFTDIDKACEGLDKSDLVRRFYVLVAGMASLQSEERTDFGGIFSEKEFAQMWEVDNYKRFVEYYPYLYECTPAAEAILSAADKAVASREKGAHLRFGHDHVILPLLYIMGINNRHKDSPSAKKLSKFFRNFESPMCTNFQLIFYRNASNDVLVKVVHNGLEVPLPVKPVSGPYYRWSDYRQWCIDNIAAIRKR